MSEEDRKKRAAALINLRPSRVASMTASLQSAPVAQPPSLPSMPPQGRPAPFVAKEAPNPTPSSTNSQLVPLPKVDQSPSVESNRPLQDVVERIHAYNYRTDGVARHMRVTPEIYSRVAEFCFDHELNMVRCVTYLLDANLPKPTGISRTLAGRSNLALAGKPSLFATEFVVPAWLKSHTPDVRRSCPLSYMEDPYIHWRLAEAVRNGLYRVQCMEAVIARALPEAQKIYRPKQPARQILPQP